MEAPFLPFSSASSSPLSPPRPSIRSPLRPSPNPSSLICSRGEMVLLWFGGPRVDFKHCLYDSKIAQLVLWWKIMHFYLSFLVSLNRSSAAGEGEPKYCSGVAIAVVWDAMLQRKKDRSRRRRPCHSFWGERGREHLHPSAHSLQSNLLRGFTLTCIIS